MSQRKDDPNKQTNKQGRSDWGRRSFTEGVKNNIFKDVWLRRKVKSEKNATAAIFVKVERVGGLQNAQDAISR